MLNVIPAFRLGRKLVHGRSTFGSWQRMVMAPPQYRSFVYRSTAKVPLHQQSSTPIHSSKQRLPVTAVRSKEDARKALDILYRNPQAIWACDTEVVNIDIHEQGPVGNGKVICASVYGGEDINFGSGPTLWIENAGTSQNVLQEFKAWFEDDRFKKVWHNYGFDRHVMENEGILCRGFAGDTMHMARLWDTSRDKATGGGDGYSLESLTEMFFHDDRRFIKTSMKELFGVAKLKKDGSASKVKVIPDLLDLQYDEKFRADWIDYSARDALATWWVRYELEKQLKKMPWVIDGVLKGNMFDFYDQYWRDFGELLTDMERNGIKVDTKNHLRQAEIRAREERSKMEQMFMDWAHEKCSQAQYLNIASTAQLQQLLFGHYENFELLSRERVFKIDKTEDEIERDQTNAIALNPYAMLTSSELKAKCKDLGLKVAGSKSDLVNRLLYFNKVVQDLSTESIESLIEKCTSRGLPIEGNRGDLLKAYAKNEVNAKKKFDELDVSSSDGQLDNGQAADIKKYREITIETIGLTPKDFTPTGIPQVSAAVLKRLAGKNLFGEGEKISTLVTTYLSKSFLPRTYLG